MAHLEKLFVPEGLPDKSYHSLDSRVTYKSEVATAEVKEFKDVGSMRKEFHPITTEIHVTELRPIKLGPLTKGSNVPRSKSANNTWERRLMSEGGNVENGHREMFRETHSESRRSHSTTSKRAETQDLEFHNPEMKSTMIRTVTSRTGTLPPSGGSSPSATLTRERQGSVEFRRRDLSPSYQGAEQSSRVVDGKCTCCPYGYHVDVDFMSYCDTLSNQSYLKQLKRIQREKRKLRQSMEIYVQDQEQSEGRSTMVNPMESQSYYQESTTNRLLDDIDSSVDQTLTSIETMMKSSKESQMYSDSGTATIQRREKPTKFNTFPKKVGKQVAQDLQTYNETFTATFNDSNRHDSNSSLSSVSTVELERVYPHTAQATAQAYSTSETTTTRTSNVTSQQLAETIAYHMPQEGGAASPQSNMTNISKESLNAIREAMAKSLQRMKELEDQVKAIPVLQVRISVLKEEKRLLGLQMQAQKHVNMVSRGVGSDSPPPSPMSPPPTLPKPKVKMAAVGDHDVNEAYVLQPELESTHVYEKETLIIDRAQQQASILNQEMLKPLTRTVGVGEGNVFDDSMHIHEKELRTVIIGQNEKTGKRNVGIECRPATRDVGVSYNFDSVEKPTMRSVGITTETTALVTSVSFRSEEFTSALRNALSKNVKSVAIQVDERQETRHVGIQSTVSSWNNRTVGVGDDSVDVEVRMPVVTRTVSIDAYPDRMNRAVNTDYGWRLDAFTNTVPQFMESETTQTEDARKYHATTMTERSVNFNVLCQTDFKVFAATDQLRHSSTNTETVLTYNTGINTELKPQMDRGINTVNQLDSRSYGVNTEGPDVKNVGIGDGIIEEDNSEEEYLFEEEGVETKTVYYSTTQDQEKSKSDKGYEIKREYSAPSHSSRAVHSSSMLQTSQSRDSSSEDSDHNEEVVEEKVWRTTGDGQFTVTTVTTKTTYDKDGAQNVQKETKTVTGGLEVLGSDAEYIQKEVEKGRTSSTFTIKGGSVSDSETGDSYISRSSFRDSITHSGQRGITSSASSSHSDAATSSALKGNTAIERVLGSEYAERVQREREKLDNGTATSTFVTKQYSSTANGDQLARGLSLRTELDNLSGLTSDDSGLSSSQSSSERVTSRHTRIVREGDTSPTVIVRETFSSTQDGSPLGFSIDSMTSSTGSWISDSSSPSGTLKSIMKKSSADSGSQRRGITFADTVVGGETDEEDEEEADSSVEEEENGGVESGSRGTTDDDSDSSYDEGCYDSREGSIVYKCKDDEAIANGIPGAQMFDQNIRETFELDPVVKEACQTLATYLEDSTLVQTKQLYEKLKKNNSLEIIQKEWFKVSSSKLADDHQVEDYLSCFNEISKRLLEYIVNMQDSNGNTAVHYAVSNCNFDIVSLLLDTGVCDLNKMNKAGYTAVIMATLASVQTQRQEEVVQRLFSMGNVNIKATKDGQTALMFAVRQGRTEMVKMLLDTGADTNIQDDEGSTALMCAAEHGHTDIVKMLLNTPGCDATICDNDGSSALSIAMDAGHKDAGVLLYAHVNFGPGHSPAPNRKTRKTSGTSPLASP